MNTKQNESWRMPPELHHSLPRAVKLSKQGWAMAIFAVLLAASAVAVPTFLLVNRESKLELRGAIEQSGIRASAEVVRTGKTKEDDPRRFADYHFEAGGNAHMGRVTLRNSDHRSLNSGVRLPIRYLPDNPGRSWVEGYEPDGPPLAAIAILPVCFAVPALILAIHVARQRSLLADGRVTAASVVGSKRIRSQHGSKHRVDYEFTALSGAVRRVTVQTGKQPADGAVVTLIYDRENPKRAAVYPLPLVRVAR